MISLLCHFWVVMRQNTIPNSVVEQSCPPYYRKEVEGSMQLGWECAIFFQGVPFLQQNLPPIKSIKLRFFFYQGFIYWLGHGPQEPHTSLNAHLWALQLRQAFWEDYKPYYYSLYHRHAEMWSTFPHLKGKPGAKMGEMEVPRNSEPDWFHGWVTWSFDPIVFSRVCFCLPSSLMVPPPSSSPFNLYPLCSSY